MASRQLLRLRISIIRISISIQLPTVYEFRRRNETPATVYYWIVHITKLQTLQANWSKSANMYEQANTEANSESNHLIRFKHIYGKANKLSEDI